MAEMTIRLVTDPTTGKKNIIVSMRSDEDLLPHEHEQQHRNIVDKLIEGGAIKAGEAGEVIIEREEEEAGKQTPTSEQPAERESLGEGA